jgi:hypothetical protein
MKNLKNFLLLIGLAGILFFAFSCKAENTNQPAQNSTDKVRINLHLSEEKIRAEILNYAPVDSSTNEVLNFARNRLKHKKMFPEPFLEKSPALIHQAKSKPTAVGKSSIEVDLGEYGFNPFLRTGVYVSWAFDENYKLIDIIVEKETNGL